MLHQLGGTIRLPLCCRLQTSHQWVSPPSRSCINRQRSINQGRIEARPPHTNASDSVSFNFQEEKHIIIRWFSFQMTTVDDQISLLKQRWVPFNVYIYIYGDKLILGHTWHQKACQMMSRICYRRRHSRASWHPRESCEYLQPTWVWRGWKAPGQTSHHTLPVHKWRNGWGFVSHSSLIREEGKRRKGEKFFSDWRAKIATIIK